MIRTLIVILILAFGKDIRACSCLYFSVCELMEETEREVFAIKVRQVGGQNLADNHRATKFLVLETFRDDVGLPDTLVLLGSPNGASCHVGFFGLNYEEEGYIFMYEHTMEDPSDYLDTSQPNTNYYFPAMCGIRVLRIRGSFVSGSLQQDINEYPISEFETDLMKCDFDRDKSIDLLCNELSLYPNPISDDQLIISQNSNFTYLEEIDIYSNTGILLKRVKRKDIAARIDLSDIPPQVLIVVLRCEERSIARRIVKI